MQIDEAKILRTPEIEEFINLYLIHPVSLRLVRGFHWCRVSPNAVSLLGMACGLGAAFLIGVGRDVPFIWLAAVFIYLQQVLDGSDGQLARLTGKCTPLGQVLDGVCDYVFYISLYFAVIFADVAHYSDWIWPLGIAAGLSHALQAAMLEYYRYEYDLWAHNKGENRHLSSADVREANLQRRGIARLFGTIQAVYVVAQETMISSARVELRLALAAALAGGGRSSAEVRQQYRHYNAVVCRRWGFLTDPERLIVLIVCCLAGYPTLFFVVQLSVFNLLLAGLMRAQSRRDRELLEWLGGRRGPALAPSDADFSRSSTETVHAIAEIRATP